MLKTFLLPMLQSDLPPDLDKVDITSMEYIVKLALKVAHTFLLTLFIHKII